MSILLNALKKSEAQRQVGQPPDIHAPVEISQDRRSAGHRWLPLVMLALSAVVMAWFGWQQYRPPEVGVASSTVEDSHPDPVPGQINENSTPEEGAATVVDMVGVQSSKPPMVANFPAKMEPEAEERKQRLSRTFKQFEAEPQESNKETGVAEPEEVADELSELESTLDAIAQEGPIDLRAKQQATLRAARAESGVTDVNEPGQNSERESAPDSEPISFWQVPQNLRDSMPEFRITVLVYAEAPEDRFVLINGVRLVEKEELASGVMLDEIRRDGAVFRYRNYRFLVKG